MVRQRKEIGITPIRYSDSHPHSILRMALRPPHGARKMPRMLILAQWGLSSCPVGWSSQMVSLASAICSMPTPSVELEVKPSRPPSVALSVEPPHWAHKCLFHALTGYARSRLVRE